MIKCFAAAGVRSEERGALSFHSFEAKKNNFKTAIKREELSRGEGELFLRKNEIFFMQRLCRFLNDEGRARGVSGDYPVN